MKYEELYQEARKKNHNKTAQYWMGYINMLHLYHEFSRSIGKGDLNLYIQLTLDKSNSHGTFEKI